MIEVERKFRLNEQNEQFVLNTFQAIPEHAPASRQFDTVYLQKGDSYDVVAPYRPVMRLRSTDEGTLLTFKRNINEAGDATEHELSVSSASEMDAILKEAGYYPAVTIDKYRQTAAIGKIALMLDRVVGVGVFLEIESIISTESELDAAVSDIFAVAADFNLGLPDVETRKYDLLSYLVQKETA